MALYHIPPFDCQSLLDQLRRFQRLSSWRCLLEMLKCMLTSSIVTLALNFMLLCPPTVGRQSSMKMMATQPSTWTTSMQRQCFHLVTSLPREYAWIVIKSESNTHMHYNTDSRKNVLTVIIHPIQTGLYDGQPTSRCYQICLPNFWPGIYVLEYVILLF